MDSPPKLGIVIHFDSKMTLQVIVPTSIEIMTMQVISDSVCLLNMINVKVLQSNHRLYVAFQCMELSKSETTIYQETTLAF